jgi:lysophospholipase L1-like esterase
MLLAAAVAMLPAQSTPAQSTPIKVVLVGDSTVNDEGGWGPGFKESLAPHVTVVNLAVNGRSTKSYRDEGRWAPALAEKADYILIQFGHNDVPGKGPERETDAATSYRDNLARYVGEARAAGAKPILVTSIVRRVFDAEGKFLPDSLVPYAAAARAVAAGLNVPLMDLYERTREQAEQLGPEGCAKLNAVTKDGKPDTTHLGPEGRKQVGILAAREFAKIVPGVLK